MQMLLLEGDDMNQKTGICILLCLVLLLVFGIWYQKRGQPAGCFFTGWKNHIYGNRDSK